MKYKVGDKVRIKSLDWYNENKGPFGEICPDFIVFLPSRSKYCGQIMTIKDVLRNTYNSDLIYYKMIEDSQLNDWTDGMIKGLAEEEMSLDKAGQITDFEYEGLAYTLPDGYQFVDENGNEILASKIILKKKKPTYPETFLGCCDVLRIEDTISRGVKGYKSNLLDTFQKLLICRDAYWKIAGEEIGLGKPWEPDWTNLECDKFCIWVDVGDITLRNVLRCQHILAFPTAEMRDAFYENFKDLIEQCKELL